MNPQTPQPAALYSLPSDDQFLDIRRLLGIFLRFKWGILGLGVIACMVAAFVVYSMQPVYRASASIVLESLQANVVNVEEVYSVDTYHYNYNQTQYEILKSRSLAERVVRRLQLQRHPVFAPATATDVDNDTAGGVSALVPSDKQAPPQQLSAAEKEEEKIKSIARRIAGGLKVSPVEFSYVVYLSYESTDPALAAKIVNTVAEEFIQSNLESRLEGTLQATDWLGERLEFLKLQLRESEQALQDFRDREGLVDIDGVTGLGGNELRSLSQRLQDATRTRIEAQNIKEDVQDMQQASTEQLMTIPAVLAHPLVRDSKRDQTVAERKVAELAKRYGPKHPKMISARSDLDAATQTLSREVRKVVTGINHEYEVALRNEQQLQENWEARKSEMQEFNRTEFELQELQRDVQANRQLYDIFFTRVKSVSETGGFEKPHARIVDRAATPSSPVKPNKRFTIMVAFVFGILLGCAIAFVLDLLDNTVKSPDDVAEKLRLPLLGSVPRQDVGKNGEFSQYWQNQRGEFAEAVRTVRTGLILSSLDDPAGVVVVTSTIAGEGKSTLALNLGAALGQMENTLVIGADLRRPSLASKCGLAPNHRGLSHFVSGTAALEDCIAYLEDKQFHVMPAGVIPPNPLEMISSTRFVDALAQLRTRFDRIVIDSAPVQAVSDALVLSSYADAVLYVVRADATPATQVQKGIASLVGSNEPLTGVVLNMFDARRAAKYYGASAYYEQYSDAQDSA